MDTIAAFAREDPGSIPVACFSSGASAHLASARWDINDFGSGGLALPFFCVDHFWMSRMVHGIFFGNAFMNDFLWKSHYDHILVHFWTTLGSFLSSVTTQNIFDVPRKSL